MTTNVNSLVTSQQDSRTMHAKTTASVLREELRTHANLNVPSIDGNVLATILNAKVEWLTKMNESMPLDSFKNKLVASTRSFYDALKKPKTHFILECKKASPSKGLIRPDFKPAEIARIYNKFASAISVLTDEKFFMGKYSYIKEVHDITNIPVLCKDFIFEPYQIYLARFNQADAVLLMLSVLTDEAYIKLSNLAHSLNMGVLTEASTTTEIERAIKLNAQVIGINNRNLRNLQVDLKRVEELSKLVPSDRIIISESGIYTHDQILKLRHFAHGFLVGSSLTATKDIEIACRKLILGENKVCGLTTFEDVKAAFNAGAVTTGFIFARSSKRYIEPIKAKEIVVQAQKQDIRLAFAGVFVNEELNNVVNIVHEIPLDVVQLHGSENIMYIKNLRAKLPKHVEIWKAIAVEQEFPQQEVSDYLKYADKVVLDTKNQDAFGGTGQSFDWRLVTGDLSRIMVAGGLNPHNVATARDLSQTIGLDLNSGIEDTPGHKNHDLLAQAFLEIKNY